MKKKKKKYSHHSQYHIGCARQWLQDHDRDDLHVVMKYRNAFHEEIHFSIREIEQFGFPLSERQIQQGLQDEKERLSRIRQKKIEKLKEEYKECNDEFSFIAGYTSGGVPYGTTWEEEGIDSDLPF